MSGRRDFSKARRRAVAYQAIRQRGPGEAEPPRPPRTGQLRGWRTEWDGEPFPVVTRPVSASVTETGEASQAPGQRAGLDFGDLSQPSVTGDGSNGTGSSADPGGRQGRKAVQNPPDPGPTPAGAHVRAREGRQAA